MKALKIILISLVAVIVAVVGLHVIALVGVYYFSRSSNRQAATTIEATKPAQPATPAAPKNARPTYVVKKGDTLVKIARAHGVSPEVLCKLNQIEDPDRIQLAQVLQLPGKN